MRAPLLLLSLLAACSESQPPPAPDARRDETPLEPTAPGAAPEGMVWIPGGTFAMGSVEGPPSERPVHEVTVSGFWLDRHEVTNAEFQRFVAATGYVTVAERPPEGPEFAGADPNDVVPGALCFTPPAHAVDLGDFTQWWSWTPGASWLHPEGPSSDLRGRMDHPVVQVAWDDAVAYAKWAGKRLPTEAEWEYAARGGLTGKHYVWGDEQKPHGQWVANIWQGRFPFENLVEDGFARSAPVGSFPPNGYGLYDMAGNVWEWCADEYRPYAATMAADGTAGMPTSCDTMPSGAGGERVIRGGSFLCSDVYCVGYRPSARMSSSRDTGLQHTGFRCAKSP